MAMINIMSSTIEFIINACEYVDVKILICMVM